MNVILNNSAESSDDDADGNADVEDEPDLPVGVAIKRLRKVFKVHACCSYTNCPMLGNPDSGIAEIFARGIRGSWALESEIQLKESGIPLTKNLESTTWNPESKNVLDSLAWSDIFTLPPFLNEQR